ncbi:hypothetical protein QFC24_006058 [Naganishia onofrii]|uniref:Uncharacterized protein n=1 Tax=Naganishia onofrii TaxID=1851511 RepID=A0ACC2X678_9TREE|nr:hypothetical protein QFC24_006058 [Naganishia onofrii]
MDEQEASNPQESPATGPGAAQTRSTSSAEHATSGQLPAQTRSVTPPINHLLTLSDIEKAQEALQDIRSQDAPPDDVMEELTISKKFDSVEIQRRLQAMIDRQRDQERRTQDLTVQLATMLTCPSTYVESTYKREQYLTTHGSQTTVRNLVQSPLFSETVEIMNRAFWQAHKNEPSASDSAQGLPPRLTSRQQARVKRIEVDNKQVRYAVALLLNKENKSKIRRYAIDYVPDQQMLKHEEWPNHVFAGFIEVPIVDPETMQVSLRKCYRPALKHLDNDLMNLFSLRSREFLKKACDKVLEAVDAAKRPQFEAPVKDAVHGHCRYRADQIWKAPEGDPTAEQKKKDEKSKIHSRRLKRSVAVYNGRKTAWGKSPYIRCLQAAEFRWLVQPELAPEILSDDEGSRYPTLDLNSDAESESDSNEERDEDGKVSGWKIYQRINNQGQQVVRSDGSPKSLFETRPCLFLRESVRCVLLLPCLVIQVADSIPLPPDHPTLRGTGQHPPKDRQQP